MVHFKLLPVFILLIVSLLTHICAYISISWFIKFGHCTGCIIRACWGFSGSPVSQFALPRPSQWEQPSLSFGSTAGGHKRTCWDLASPVATIGAKWLNLDVWGVNFSGSTFWQWKIENKGRLQIHFLFFSSSDGLFQELYFYTSCPKKSFMTEWSPAEEPAMFIHGPLWSNGQCSDSSPYNCYHSFPASPFP